MPAHPPFFNDSVLYSFLFPPKFKGDADAQNQLTERMEGEKQQ